MQTKIVGIAAVAENGAIGFEDHLPWPRLAEDLKFFRDQTLGSSVIMGYNCARSIGFKPLYGRANIVLTTRTRSMQGFTCADSPKLALSQAIRFSQTGKVFIIGGAKTYKAFEGMYDSFLVTEVARDYQGDTFFDWTPVDQLPHFRQLGTAWEECIDLTFTEYYRQEASIDDSHKTGRTEGALRTGQDIRRPRKGVGYLRSGRNNRGEG